MSQQKEHTHLTPQVPHPVHETIHKSVSTPCELSEREYYWQKDEDAKTCTKCDKSFGLTRRRSHCRCCGYIFCSECSSHRIEIPDSAQKRGPQKVCDNCYFYLVGLEAEKNEEAVQPDYDKVSNEIIKQVGEVMGTEEKKWKLTCDNKGVQIWKLALPNTHIYCFRTTVVVEKTPAEVWNIYSKQDLWKHWQPQLESRLIEEVSEGNTVLYLSYKLPIIDNRDSCVYSFFKRGTFSDPNNSEAISLYSRTIDHPKCPITKQMVRCFCSLSYTTIEPHRDPSGKTISKLTSILHIDPRGLVPAFFINTILSTAVDSIVVMKKWIEAHAHEYSGSPL